MLGEIFSVTNLVSVAFLAYMGNSVFTLGKFWFPETCPEDADFDGKIGWSKDAQIKWNTSFRWFLNCPMRDRDHWEGDPL